MLGYQEVETQADMDRMLDHIASFHDSMTKEFRLVNRGYVRPDHAMVMGRFDGQLLIQSQWPPYAMELVFSNILELHVHDAHEYWSASGKVLGISRSLGVSRAVQMDFDGRFKIVAERMFHADRSEWLGQRSFLGPEVPSVDAVKAHRIEAKWRQCSVCSDAWEEEERIVYSLCPNCGRLTEFRQ